MAWTDTSTSRMQGVDPRLIELVNHLQAQGHNIQISEGLRNAARQQELYDAGKSKTLNSKHLTGNAIDFHLRDAQGNAIWDEAAYMPVGADAKAYAEAHGIPLTWGGDWGWDFVHFQTDDGPYNKGGTPKSAGLPAADPDVLKGITGLAPEANTSLEEPDINKLANIVNQSSDSPNNSGGRKVVKNLEKKEEEEDEGDYGGVVSAGLNAMETGDLSGLGAAFADMPSGGLMSNARENWDKNMGIAKGIGDAEFLDGARENWANNKSALGGLGSGIMNFFGGFA